MPTNGCSTEGCQYDKGNETYYYVKYLEEHGNEGLAALTKFWYRQVLANLATRRPEDGPATAADDPFLLTLQAVNTDAADNSARYGLTPGGTLTFKDLLNGGITFALIFPGGGGYTEDELNDNAVFAEGNLDSLEVPRSAQDILMPGGQPIGKPGLNEGVRTLSNASEIEDLYNELKVMGTPVSKPSYPGGVMYEMPGGGLVGYRAISKYGGPTIDVYIPGIPFEGILLP